MTSRAPAPDGSQLDTLLSEQRRFPPPAEFAARATATRELYERAGRDWLQFWDHEARALDWTTPWTRVLDWTPPHARWFVGGTLNAAANCVDRHLTGPGAIRPRSSGRASRVTGGC